MDMEGMEGIRGLEGPGYTGVRRVLMGTIWGPWYTPSVGMVVGMYTHDTRY